MAKPILRFKVNQQSAEVGGKYYGIIEDTPVTPENSILQICEYKKITAFTPEQVLRLVEDVCDGAAKLVSRDGQSRQISSLLKFSPRVRGTFAATDSRWTDQRLIVGARLLKDIKLEMAPSDFVMSNVADIGSLSSAALTEGSTGYLATPAATHPQGATWHFNVNGAKLDSWSTDNVFAKLAWTDGVDVYEGPDCLVGDFATNGFTVSSFPTDAAGTARTLFNIPASVVSNTPGNMVVIIYHPEEDIEFKRLVVPVV